MMHSGREYVPFLEAIARSEPQIQAVLFTDLAGVLKSVVERTTTTTPTPNTDQLHAFLGCAIAQSYVEMGSQHALNQLHTVIVEYQRGTLLLSPTGSGVLIVQADPGANIGLIRHKIKIVAQKLRKLESKLERHPILPLGRIPSELSAKHLKTPESGAKSPPTEKKEHVDDKEVLKQALEALDSL